MNFLPPSLLQKANEEAIYNVYMYLAHKTTPVENETLLSIVNGLEAASESSKDNWSNRDRYRLNILRNAIENNATLANSRLGNLTRSKEGLTACSFTKPSGDISVIFKGTGSGEWIDNGEGLSGISEENTYITYSKRSKQIYRKVVQNDYATDRQVEALNWFLRLAAANGWNNLTPITVSGHSKGGNKAQFITIHSDLVHACYSFDGQGFSSEALAALKNQYGEKYEQRRQNISSFATDNDYVNVLGARLVPENHIYYFEAFAGIHFMEALLDKEGRFRPQCEQGKLSKYAQTVSEELMSLPPSIRQYATLGIMNVFQKYLGKETSENKDTVSIEKTIAEIAVAIAPLIYHLHRLKDV